MRYPLSELLYFYHFMQSTLNCSTSYSCVCDGFLFNNPSISLVFIFCSFISRLFTVIKITGFKSLKPIFINIVQYNSKNKANWFACFSIFLLLKLILHTTLSNIAFHPSSLTYLTRLYEIMLIITNDVSQNSMPILQKRKKKQFV